MISRVYMFELGITMVMVVNVNIVAMKEVIVLVSLKSLYFILHVQMAKNKIMIKIRYKKAPVNPIYTDSKIVTLVQ